MDMLGIIGILVGLLAFVFVTVKGMNTILGAPLVTLVVILFNQMPIMDSLVGPENSYMKAFSTFILANFSIFLLGAVLAKYMEKSGATQSIANRILRLTGTEKPYSILLAIYIIACIVTMGGISFFVVCFALIPMAKPLFKRLNIAWNLVTIPLFAGMATWTMSMIPGSPAIVNVVPSNALGTGLTAAPLLGIIASIVVIIYCLFYMKRQLNKSIANGENYSTYVSEEEDFQTINQEKLPSFVASITPIIALLAIVLIFRNVPNIVLVALTVSILLSAILFRKQVPKQMKALNEGALDSVIPVFSTSSTVAFGTLLTSAPAFEVVKNLIMSIPGSPLISLSVSTGLLSLITGSAAGTVGIAMQSFAPEYIAMGIDPEIVHRVSAISSALFGVMPYTGLVITFNTLAKLNLKSSFKHQFMTVSVGHMLSLIVVLIVASFMM